MKKEDLNKRVKLMLGDNIESLKKLPANSIDSVVTDGPYGLTFMGKKWDYDVPSVEFWKEVYRVLKPGGHIVSFGGTRTYHRMVVNIEDAGFEIRDQIMWIYGSGFPKSLNVGKAVDKLNGSEREVVGKRWELSRDGVKRNPKNHNDEETQTIKNMAVPSWNIDVTKGTSEWEGFGTALKPANEPICLARKPLSEKSVAENVLKWRTGGINVDGCRVGFQNENDKESAKPGSLNATGKNSMFGLKSGNEINDEGRFPANIIFECICDEVIKGEKGEVKMRDKLNKHSGSSLFNTNIIGSENYDYKDKGDIHTNPDCPCRLLDEQSGESKSSKSNMKSAQSGNNDGRYNWNNGEKNDFESVRGHNDKGGASRFFYQAKVSKAERNMGLDGFEEKQTAVSDKAVLEYKGVQGKYQAAKAPAKNNHPTVKPINLMTYLCRLITPANGIVLDPFMGSGSTGVAAQLEGFRFVGMEMDSEYFKIAEARIENFEKYTKFTKK